MTNSAKETELKGFLWTIQVPSSCNQILQSNTFNLLNSKCYFTFFSGIDTGDSNAFLNFVCDEGMELPIKIIVCDASNKVRIALDENTGLKSEIKTINTSNETIWYDKRHELKSRSMTFEVIFLLNTVKGDKAVQTPPYIDTGLLMESSSKDFAKLLDESPNYDVEFAFEDQTIKAHKHILCCQSEIFKSILQSDMIEGKTRRINIEDVKPTIFSQFLRCLYTGMLTELTIDTAVELYKISDKYSVYELKQQCAEFLIDNLSVSNACEILVLANQYNDEHLKMTVMEYAFKEKIPLMEEKWTSFCNEYPRLAVEVLNLFYKQLCQK